MNFWKGKKVLVTGHTGFKGAWLTLWLRELGAHVVGFSLQKYDNDILFHNLELKKHIVDCRGDIRQFNQLQAVFYAQQPDIVFHLAAQPIVRTSYDFPRETAETNTQGTVNVLECIRQTPRLRAGVMITTDKVYENKGHVWGYREDDVLGGHDVYSSSKACAELLISAYRRSFFKKNGQYIASARAGNVIGGGDWSADRIIPDCVRALQQGRKIEVRNPKSTRPWQHVLEPLSGYLLLAQKMWTEQKFDEAWNFGPRQESIQPVERVVELFLHHWKTGAWVTGSSHSQKHEARTLSLDISKAYHILGWAPYLTLQDALQWTAEWYAQRTSALNVCKKQITAFSHLWNGPNVS